MRGDLCLRIGRTAAADADVFAHGIIKEIIILQDERRLIVELLRRDLFQIVPARTQEHRRAAAERFPQTADPACRRSSPEYTP